MDAGNYRVEKFELTENELIELYYETQKLFNRFVKKKGKKELFTSWHDGFENRYNALQLASEFFIMSFWATAGRVCEDKMALKSSNQLLGSIKEIIKNKPRLQQVVDTFDKR